MKRLLPILLLIIGTAGGAGAGFFLRPDPVPPEEHGSQAEPAKTKPEPSEETREFVKLDNQFVIPVVDGDEVASLVVLSLSLEVMPGAKETVYSQEPKLRSSLLQVLFDHANLGGFRGEFTSVDRLEVLRVALLDAVQAELGGSVTDVLILEIGRQDY